MTNQPNLNIPAEHLPWAVAGAWRPCTNIHCHNGTVDILDVRGTRLEDCPECGGSGRIYAVPDTVRVPCPHSKYLSPEFCWPCLPLCGECGGPGWTPSTDLAVWIDAALSFGKWGVIFTPPKYDELLPGDWIVSRTQNHVEDIQRALAQALVAEGRTLGEVANA